jgi:hypothetical protein
VLLGFAVLQAEPPKPDCSAVAGWTQKGEVRSFVPDNLFEYMNGNAEGYILYDFERMTGVTCQSGENEFLIDVSEMASPEMAYGMFAANRHPKFDVKKIGLAGQIMPRRATFAKGRYYLEIAANPAKNHTAALEAFVRDLEPKVPGATEPPAALGWFPEEVLEKDSVRLVPQSVLGLRMLRRGYVAVYSYGRAFIVREASPDAAAGLFAKLKARMTGAEPAGIGEEAFLGKDKYLGQMSVARQGSFLFGFAGLKDGTDAKAVTSALAANIRQ